MWCPASYEQYRYLFPPDSATAFWGPNPEATMRAYDWMTGPLKLRLQNGWNGGRRLRQRLETRTRGTRGGRAEDP